MRYYQCGVVLMVLVGLVSCSKSSHSVDPYLTSSETAAHITVPAGAQAPTQDVYYQVPSATSQGATPPSIEPPTMNHSTSTALASKPATSTARRITLILAPANAWNELGEALNKDTDLKLVDHDKAIKTYYVLDTRETSGAVKKKTPVYRVTLNSIEAGMLVRVTDEKGGPIAVADFNKIIISIKKSLGV